MTIAESGFHFNKKMTRILQIFQFSDVRKYCMKIYFCSEVKTGTKMLEVMEVLSGPF